MGVAKHDLASDHASCSGLYSLIQKSKTTAIVKEALAPQSLDESNDKR